MKQSAEKWLSNRNPEGNPALPTWSPRRKDRSVISLRQYPRQSASITDRLRVSRCRRCHSHKIKCSGGSPCRNCQQTQPAVECIYPWRDRKVLIQESYLKKLEEESERWKESQKTDREAGITPLSQPSNQEETRPGNNADTQPSSVETQNNIPLTADAEIRNPLLGDRAWFVRDRTSINPIYIGEAACTAFGTRLRQFLNGDEPVAPLPGSVYFADHTVRRTTSPEFKLPNRTYAHLLLRVAVRFIGEDYHLMLRRTTAEQLDSVYRDNWCEDRLLLCRLFILFAIGELYSNRKPPQPVSPSVPGVAFFRYAMSMFEDLHEEAAVPYIELLVLMSLYFMALNRVTSAYVYIGTALRLSLTLGLHHNVPEGSIITPVEREHRVRVWWTVYTFDRLWSSKLGHPIGIRDSDIAVDMPSMERISPQEQEEFSDPEHLIAVIKLARTAGDIISDIYGRPRVEGNFVQSVHKILRNLRAWAEDLPPNVKLNQNSPRYKSRHTASLHLAFNQCVVLTTRPILFHLFKSRFESSATPRAPSAMVSALAETCVVAARSSNNLLIQLWVEGSLAVFGYLDAQYIFSSTIILSMSAVLQDSEPDRDAVETATDILQSMAEDGNLPAGRFYQHLREIQKGFSDSKQKGKPLHGTQGLIASVQTAVDGTNLDGGPSRTNLLSSMAQDIGQELSTTHQTALDDPFILDFLAQDTYMDVSGMLGLGGNVVSPSRWMFE
ncbi:hypothetical protein P170DRAFT_402737 [Aspergillus steynii IBT 23096]|uniref:Zn(2)-C6 fungal-type domain-containing protein n=1 Tax=Aspergillus steynii IBT 23096 TaxID=1392250 RepID=A0A2I2GHZ9_9EURO|nr:uncharacterized protein P170DRAFT_402737 [Aspergillus steynii IBT 23096]PLB52500.1 hypothetical protein P170DRAFT_402737 [Aspergillus steynii IBT 23096]